jgi:hypothetical protein
MTFKTPPAFSKADLRQGFEILNQLWNRNLVPDDLERHYFLYWFVVYGGNICETARALQIHRNTIQGHFLKFDFSNKAVFLRHSWNSLVKSNPNAAFESHFLKFYRSFSGGIRLTREENRILVLLWKTRFAFKSLTPHYLIWGIKTRQPKKWVLKKLGFTQRHRNRLLTASRDPETRDGFWLSSLTARRAKRSLRSLFRVLAGV